MNPYLLLALRIIHIFAGTLWVGTAVFYLFYVKPSILALGPTAPQFVDSLVRRRKMPIYMFTISLLAVSAGIWLYAYDSGGFNQLWMGTATGAGLTIGSVAGLVAFVVGNFQIGPLTGQLGALGEAIGKSGSDPSPAQLEEMGRLEKKLSRAEWIDFSMLVICVLLMAISRYLVF